VAPKVYLDIETDWNRVPTIIGVQVEQEPIQQLIGTQITQAALVALLPVRCELFTYNGHSFDLTVIRESLGLNLRQAHDSIDLRWVCQRNGIKGGQKLIEQFIGVRRALPDLDGYEALKLWDRYQGGCQRSLQTLLQYNEEDVKGLAAIREYLLAQGISLMPAANLKRRNSSQSPNSL